MATYKVRGNAHNVIYPYKTPDGAKKQQWETYETELEAVQRKAYIDYLQKSRNADEHDDGISRGFAAQANRFFCHISRPPFPSGCAGQ